MDVRGSSESFSNTICRKLSKVDWKPSLVVGHLPIYIRLWFNPQHEEPNQTKQNMKTYSQVALILSPELHSRWQGWWPLMYPNMKMALSLSPLVSEWVHDVDSFLLTWSIYHVLFCRNKNKFQLILSHYIISIPRSYKYDLLRVISLLGSVLDTLSL